MQLYLITSNVPASLLYLLFQYSSSQSALLRCSTPATPPLLLRGLLPHFNLPLPPLSGLLVSCRLLLLSLNQLQPVSPFLAFSYSPRGPLRQMPLQPLTVCPSRSAWLSSLRKSFPYLLLPPQHLCSSCDLPFPRLSSFICPLRFMCIIISASASFLLFLLIIYCLFGFDTHMIQLRS